MYKPTTTEAATYVAIRDTFVLICDIRNYCRAQSPCTVAISLKVGLWLVYDDLKVLVFELQRKILIIAVIHNLNSCEI